MKEAFCSNEKGVFSLLYDLHGAYRKGANHKVQCSKFNVQRLKAVVVVLMPNAFVRSPGAAPPTVMV